MEKFGYASATTTVTSAPGSTSRARSAALMPASLPPMATMCMTTSCFPVRGPGCPSVTPGTRRAVPVTGGPGKTGRIAVRGLVRDDDPGGLGGTKRGVENSDDGQPGDAAADLGRDEHRP